jgi:hypothetical protein
MADYSIEVAIPNQGPAGPQGPPGEFGELEAPQDGIIYGRKDGEWVDMTAPANLQVRRGTAAEVAAITPLEGEPVWATDTKKLSVGDAATAGGIEVGPRIPQFSAIFPTTNTVLSAGRSRHTLVNGFNTSVFIDLPHIGNQRGDEHLVTLSMLVGSPTLTLRRPSTMDGDTVVAYATIGQVSSASASFFLRNITGLAADWTLVPTSLAQNTRTTIANATDAQSTQDRLNDLLAVLRRLQVIS